MRDRRPLALAAAALALLLGGAAGAGQDADPEREAGASAAAESDAEADGISPVPPPAPAAVEPLPEPEAEPPAEREGTRRALGLPRLDRGEAATVAAVGVLLLLLGWPFYRSATILAGAVVLGAFGFAAGRVLVGPTAGFVAGGIMALGGALLARPFETALRCIVGGLTAGAVGAALGVAFGDWLVAILAACSGLCLGAAFVYFAFRPSLILATSLVGASLLVAGLASLVGPPGDPITLAPLHGLVAGVISFGGMLFQFRLSGRPRPDDEERFRRPRHRPMWADE